MNQSLEFLKKIDDLQKKEIPSEVIMRAKQSLLDYIAVTAAGAAFQSEKLANYSAFIPLDKGEYKVIGTDITTTLKESVFLNGLNGHALDFDDGTNSGIIHLGSPIFSLLLPLAKKYDISIDDMLKAAVIGYETSYTMAVSIQPGHKGLGYHATGTCGVLGATIAASYMLGFTDEERFQAFASACVSASGMLLVLDDGSELKPYNVAKTALLAMTSLQLAKAGFKGHPDPLGAPRGYLKMMTGRGDIELKPLLLNGTYAIQKSYTKPYASCRYTHPAVEAAIYMRNQYGIKAEDVEKIEISTYSLAVAGHDHTEIPGTYSAKMSTPYSVAVSLIYGRAGLQEFTEENIKDPAVSALTKKVRVVSDEEMSRNFPEKQTAVAVVYANGRTYTHQVDFPKGEPENAMLEDEFKMRYDALMEYGRINAENRSGIYSIVYQNDAKVQEILDLL